MSNSHVIVVGSGIAGLHGALLAAESGMRVTLMTKSALVQSNTHQAQGGICAVLGPDQAAPGDSVEAHIADTLKAGAGQCNAEAVRILCTEAASDIAALERFGVTFDRDPGSGQRALGLEGAHSAARILHAGGDATGAVIADALIAAVLDAAELGLIRIMEHCLVTELLTTSAASRQATDDGVTPAGALAEPRASISGVAYLQAGGGAQEGRSGFEGHRAEAYGAVASGADEGLLAADAVLLACGGAGQLFEFTTNPAVATGDGVALAWRAGAVVGDLEYFQFHPTALALGGNFLISEAVRGAGAVLRDDLGEQFMTRYHPLGDLAPRDVVSRSIAAHLADRVRAAGARAESVRAANAGVAGNNAAGATLGVYLDATGVEDAHGAGYLARRFPTIDAATSALGFDWRREWLPVAPAAHYWMGGVATDLHGRTSVPGLYAAGEAACSGVHGANRLASNSLLEGLVFSRRAVAAFVAAAPVDAASFAAASIDAASSASFGAQGRWPEFTTGVRSLAGVADAAVPLTRSALRRLMSDTAGVVRDAHGLRHAATVLKASAPSTATAPQREASLPERPSRSGAGSFDAARQQAEDRNLHLVAELLVHAALAREESVGAHFRSDFPHSHDFPDAPDFLHGPPGESIRESIFWVNPAAGMRDASVTYRPISPMQRESESV